MTIHQRYKETLTYLFRQLPMFQRVGAAAFKKDLTNITALCEQLDQPQYKFPSIHIAGTNGKGSTTHILAAIFQASGHKVGVYTSPHYKDFRERIKINGQLVSKKYVVDFVDNHKPLFEYIRPSFFEITVAMAFHYFAQQKVDIAIIETGLGGRLDSTNILQPLLSVITNIGYDHQQFLGDTLPEIASEKAGIIKPNTPIVIGETQAATKPVFDETANRQQAPIYYADDLLAVKKLGMKDAFNSIYSIQSRILSTQEAKVNLIGDYQTNNLQTALGAIDILLKYNLWKNIPPNHILSGLSDLKKSTYFIGRWQQIGSEPTIIVDSAHNIEGIKIAMRQVHNLDYRHLYMIFGMVNDKDTEKILPLLPSTALYYFVKANIPRGLDANLLREKAKKHGLNGRSYVSVKNALKAAKKKAAKEDLIYVGGSIFVVAEVL